MEASRASGTTAVAVAPHPVHLSVTALLGKERTRAASLCEAEKDSEESNQAKEGREKYCGCTLRANF